jgi:hypothetical protein
MLSINEQRALLGYNPFEGDELADIPVMLETMRRMRVQVEAQAGYLENQLGGDNGSNGEDAA